MIIFRTMKIKLNKEDLVIQLQEQLKILALLCSQYDQRNDFLYKEIAVKLRLLFHNTKNSQSLLSKIGLDNIEFSTSAKNIAEQSSQGIYKAPIYMTFRTYPVDPPVRITPELIPILYTTNFTHWWEHEIMMYDKDNVTYTRKHLILEVADTDGGAHVDSSLNAAYHTITRISGSGVSYKLPDAQEVYLNPVPALIRQIGHEVISTFKEIDFATIH